MPFLVEGDVRIQFTQKNKEVKDVCQRNLFLCYYRYKTLFQKPGNNVIVVLFSSGSFIADSFCAIVTAVMMWATMLPLSIYSGQILLQVTKPTD